MPKVSIIVPAYNAEKHIGETIESILAQTFTDFECIIVDDGSTDGTLNEIKKYSDSRIKVIEQQNSGGPAKPRNVGIHHARGEFLCIFDSDDLMAPNKLERSISCMESFSGINFIFTNFSSMNESGGIIKENFLFEYETLWKLLPCGRDTDSCVVSSATMLRALLIANFIGTSSVILRKSAVLNKFEFNEDLKNCDDYLFWITFLRSNDAMFLNEILHKYRISSGGISARSYIYRGANIIKALLIIKSFFDGGEEKAIISKSLANEYASISYAFIKDGNYIEAKKNAILSVKEDLSVRAIKLLMHSLLLYFKNILS